MSDNVCHLPLCGFRLNFPEISELNPLTTSLAFCLTFVFFNIFLLSKVSTKECHCSSTACALMQKAGEPSPEFYVYGPSMIIESRDELYQDIDLQ